MKLNASDINVGKRVMESNQHRGIIMPIGGAENKQSNPVILKRFIECCGGKDANIVIIPTASSLDDTGSSYQEVFKDLGAANTTVLNPKKRADSRLASNVDLIENADGVFMTGGDQMKLATIINGTMISEAIRDCNQQGLVVAGTSAGASYMSEHMIAGGKTGLTPSADRAKLATGLGIFDYIIIDQHFRQRNRLGRLITATSFNTYSLGMGFDEDTAAIIDENSMLEVIGSGWVTIVDPSKIDMTMIDSKQKTQALSVTDIQLHMLTSGSKYDLIERRAIV